MASVFKPTVTRKLPDGIKVSEKSRYYWGKYKHPVTRKPVRFPLETEDKSLAKDLANEAERKAKLDAVGLGNRFEKQLARPLADHLDEFKQALLDRGNTEDHAQRTYQRAKAVIDGIKVTLWTDIVPGAVLGWLADQQRQDGIEIEGSKKVRRFGAETRNHFTRAIKSFCRWLVKDGRAPINPLESLSLVNSRPDQKVRRRALSDQELANLLKVTAPGEVVFGMSGTGRHALYLLAVTTGLRQNELRSLTPRSFQLDAEPPVVRVAAGYSKRRREDELPLRVDVVAVLKKHLGGKAPDAPAFPMPERWDVAEMLRHDLGKAGIDDEDQDGCIVDFHSLRHTFISSLARSGIHPKTAQALARHSDINLTMSRYTHSVLTEQADAVEALPSLLAGRDREPMRKAVGATCDVDFVVPAVVPDERKPTGSGESQPVCCDEADERVTSEVREACAPADGLLFNAPGGDSNPRPRD